MELEPTNAYALYSRILGDGPSCASVAWTVFGIASSLIAAVLAFIAGVIWIILACTRRWALQRPLLLVMCAIAVILIGAVGAVLFLESSLKRVAVAEGALFFRFCDGARTWLERVALSDIAQFAYRQRRIGGTPPQFADELLITVNGRSEPIVMPLERDREAMDHVLLARLVPHEVLARWVAALRERGLPRPWNLVLTSPDPAP